jgi:hypothetical protein
MTASILSLFLSDRDIFAMSRGVCPLRVHFHDLRRRRLIIQIYEQLSIVNLIFRMKSVDKQELANQSSLFLGCLEKLLKVHLVLLEVLYKTMLLIKYL